MKNITNGFGKFILALCFLTVSLDLWAAPYDNSNCPQQITPDTIENLFREELSHFPQEKIYLQTDRGIY